MADSKGDRLYSVLLQEGFLYWVAVRVAYCPSDGYGDGQGCDCIVSGDTQEMRTLVAQAARVAAEAKRMIG